MTITVYKLVMLISTSDRPQNVFWSSQVDSKCATQEIQYIEISLFWGRCKEIECQTNHTWNESYHFHVQQL